ncbi:Serine/threonine-protein phosphatase 7 long form-like protein [Bienertia sinuspersici]
MPNAYNRLELYYPHRVLRQFGFEQTIPAPCDTNDKLHHFDGRCAEKNYQRLHASYIDEWRRREQTIVSGTPFTGNSISDYMSWYRGITRLLITPPSIRRPTSHYQPATTDHVLSRSVADMASRCMRAVEGAEALPVDKALPFALETLRSLASTCMETLSKVGQSHLLPQLDPTRFQHTSVPSTSSGQPSRPPPLRASRGRGRQPRSFRSPRGHSTHPPPPPPPPLPPPPPPPPSPPPPQPPSPLNLHHLLLLPLLNHLLLLPLLIHIRCLIYHRPLPYLNHIHCLLRCL